MPSLLKRFLKDSSIYSLEPILTKSVVFLLIPLYTSYLTTAEYGNLELILTFGTFYFTIIELGLLSSFWKFTTKSSVYSESQVIYNMSLIILLTGGVLLFLSFFIFEVIWSTFEFSTLVLVIFLAYLIKKLFTIILTIFRAHFNAKLYLIATLTNVVLFVLLNLIFVVYFSLGFKGIVYSYLVSSLFSFFLFLFFIDNNYSRSSIDKLLSKKMLSYGVPIMFGNVFAVVITLSSRFFLKELSTDEELGQYSFGFKFGNLVRIFLINTFFLTWNPLRWEIYERKDGKEIFAKFYRYLLLLLPALGFFVLGIVLIIAPIITMQKSYLVGLQVTIIIGMSFVLHGLYYFNAMGMLFMNKTKMIMVIITVSGIINLICNYLLIPIFGILGAAIAMMISYFIMFILGRYFSQKYYTIKRNAFKEFLQVTLIVIFSFISTMLLFYFDSYFTIGFLIIFISFLYLILSLLVLNIRFIEIVTFFNNIKSKVI